MWVWWGRHCWGGGFVQQSPPTILPCVVWRGAEIKQRVHSSATSALMSSWRPCIFGLLETTGVPVTELSMMDPKTRAPTSPLPASLWKHMAQNLLRLPRQSQFLFVAPVLLLSSAQLSSTQLIDALCVPRGHKNILKLGDDASKMGPFPKHFPTAGAAVEVGELCSVQHPGGDGSDLQDRVPCQHRSCPALLHPLCLLAVWGAAGLGCVTDWHGDTAALAPQAACGERRQQMNHQSLV